MEETGFIKPHGGYRELHAYRLTEIVYDGTVAFCKRCLERRSRTNDQMIQAARSGKQNTVEASLASGTSTRTEIVLNWEFTTADARVKFRKLYPARGRVITWRMEI